MTVVAVRVLRSVALKSAYAPFSGFAESVVFSVETVLCLSVNGCCGESSEA